MKAHKEDDTPTRLALLEQSYKHVAENLREIKEKIDFTTREIKAEIKEIKNEVTSLREHVDARLDKINNRLWSLFLWMVGGGCSILYVIAKSNHWLS